MDMVNIKEAWKGLCALAVGGTGGTALVIAPVVSGSYEVAPLTIGLTALFIILTALGIKEINKNYAEGELDI